MSQSALSLATSKTVRPDKQCLLCCITAINHRHGGRRRPLRSHTVAVAQFHNFADLVQILYHCADLTANKQWRQCFGRRFCTRRAHP